MNNKEKTQISKFLSLVLRHKPEEIGVTMDEHGWINTDDIVDAFDKRFSGFTYSDLVEIVESDEKGRYAFSEDNKLIRATQGHSVNIDLELKAIMDIPRLFHGTSSRFIDSIMKEGLKPMSRNYVQLSPDTSTASAVGKRHGGELIILEVNVTDMLANGYEFFRSENGVYLTKDVPAKYLIKVNSVELDKPFVQRGRVTNKFKEFMDDLRMEQQEQM